MHYTFQENGILVICDKVSNNVKLKTVDGQEIKIEGKNRLYDKVCLKLAERGTFCRHA